MSHRRPSTMMTVTTIHLVHNSCSSTPWTKEIAITSLSSLALLKPTTKTILQSPLLNQTSTRLRNQSNVVSQYFLGLSEKAHSQLSNEKWPHKVSSSANSSLFIHASTSYNHWATSQQIVHRHTLQPMGRRGFLPRQGSQSTSHSYWAVLPQFRTSGQRNYCWVDIISTKCIVGVFTGGRHWVSACIIAMFSMFYLSLVYPS